MIHDCITTGNSGIEVWSQTGSHQVIDAGQENYTPEISFSVYIMVLCNFYSYFHQINNRGMPGPYEK